MLKRKRICELLRCACLDVNTATCSDCASGTCPNQILPNILKEKKLTSGYMGIFSSDKPKGIIAHIFNGRQTFTHLCRHKDHKAADVVKGCSLEVKNMMF